MATATDTHGERGVHAFIPGERSAVATGARLCAVCGYLPGVGRHAVAVNAATAAPAPRNAVIRSSFRQGKAYCCDPHTMVEFTVETLAPVAPADYVRLARAVLRLSHSFEDVKIIGPVDGRPNAVHGYYLEPWEG